MRWSRSSLRLAIAVWILSASHLTFNVVRETYLAVALAERGTVRVDPYLGLNPDLFEIPGRGAFINSNPGASLLAAAPYAAVRPLLEALYRSRPAMVSAKPPASYDDPRPNRTTYMNAMRERGMDVRLAIAAIVMQIGLMAPLAALAALLMRRFLIARGVDRKAAFALALLYAVSTPILFRSAYLNQNALLAHAVLFAWVVLRSPGHDRATEASAGRWIGAGALLGTGVLLDYSALPIAGTFTLWALREDRLTRKQGAPSSRRVAAFALGAAGPLGLLLAYQALAFGSPWLPAQSYMPETPFSVRGWYGLTFPSVDLLWRNLVDIRYGLFAFCPLLLLALASGRFGDGPGATDRDERRFAWLACAGLWLFESANQYANLQWNTGVRYLLPAVPLIFLLAVPVMLQLSRRALALWVIPTLVVSWAVSMARESVPESLRLLFSEGPTLPIVRTLHKTATAYAPLLADRLQPWGILSVLLLAGGIGIVWFATRRVAHE